MSKLGGGFKLGAMAGLMALAAPALAQLGQAMSGSAATKTEIVPPASAPKVNVPGATILRGGSHGQILQGLKVKRQLSFQTLKASPTLQLGRARLNLAPVLDNPAALHNVAQRLRGQPQLVRVLGGETRGFEIDQGLIISSSLSYAIKPGGCNTAARRAQLQTAGVSCFTRTTAKLAVAPNAGNRAMSPGGAAQRAAEAQAGIKADIGQLKAMLATPAGRAKIEAELGSAETARLTKLSDDQLEEEAVNSQSVTVEQLMFVPSADLLDTDIVRRGPASPKFIDVAPPAEKVDVKRELTPRIFLTGFTLGRKFEWSKRVETTIKWCLVGCKKTYYAEAYAKFEYAFGLRFPVRLDGTYEYQRKGSSETATVTPRFVPINGSAADYAAAGLPADQIHNGQELVAFFDATAGGGFNVPFYPPMGGELALKKDLAAMLPPPFTGGQFTPPAPGTSTPAAPFIFTDVDLIGGRANFGVVAAQIFPAVKISLHSNGLRFVLHDNATGKDADLIASGAAKNLGITAERESSFSIGSPLYTLGFDLTPGLDARLSVNIAVWSNHWDVAVWFPQMTVTLPPDGAKFSCHIQTICTRNYKYSPSAQSESEGAGSPELAKIDNAGNSFELNWTPKCFDKQCKTGIKWLRAGATGQVKTNLETGIWTTHGLDADIKYFFGKAGIEAQGMVDASQKRKYRKDADGWVLLYYGTWTPRCSDDLCRNRVKSLIDEMGNTLVERWLQGAAAGVSTTTITGQVGAEYQPKLQKEIAESTARARTRSEPFNPAPSNSSGVPPPRKP